jgi:hypothetical protein
MYIKEIHANVKTQISLKNLTPCVLVVGDNYDGKTGVVSAIRLALTGTHPVGATAKKIATLARRGDSELYSRIVFDDGEESSYAVDGVNNARPKIHPPNMTANLQMLIDPDRVMPLFSSRELLDAGPEVSRRALMLRFGELASVPEPRALNRQQQAVWNRVRQETTCDDPIEQLTAMIRTFASTTATRTANSLSALIKEKEAELSQIPTAGAEMLHELQARLLRARDAERLSQTRATHESVLAQIEAKETRKRSLETRLVELDAVHNELLKDADISVDGEVRLRAALQLIEWAIECERASCPCCGSSTNIDQLPDRKFEIDGLLLRSGKQRAQAEAVRKSAHTEYKRLLDEISTLRTRADALREALGEDAAYSGPTSPELANQIAEINRRSGLAQEVENLAGTEREARDEAAILKICKSEAMRLRGAALENCKSKAEAAVNQHLERLGKKATLRLTDTVCEWCLSGKDGEPGNRHLISGAERAVLSGALARAWTSGAPLRVLTLDDEDLAMLGPNNLRAQLEQTRSEVEAGIFDCCFAVWPSARLDKLDTVPDGWMVINLGEINDN